MSQLFRVRALACALSLFALAAVTSRAAIAQTPTVTPRFVVGRVVDAETSQPLAGAAVQLAGTTRGTIANARGDFRIELSPLDGTASERVRVRVTIIGYQTLETEVATGVSGTPYVPGVLALTPVAIPIPGAEVASHLARENRSPTAFSTLDRGTIERDHYGQDVPILLAETPGAYAYSDAGNGIGYSYLKIRGFPQRRIAVTINGIPLNDPQSREVYWIDHPDLAASAQSIQVQRGVGSSAYGTTAIGGSVNVETIPFEESPRLTFEAGGGSFGTQRYSAQAASGLINEKYAIEARLSRILTDGYREQSWSDLWSYSFGLTRVDARAVTRLNFYGGPERTHLAYLGVPRENLDGAVTGDVDHDRRLNPITWTGERDNFFEPHYELLHDRKLGDRAALSSALFYFPGTGYYDELRTDQNLQDYGLATATNTTLTRRRWAKNVHLGWVPRVRFESQRYSLEGGLDLRWARGRRFGEVTWSAETSPEQQPNHVYYDYVGRVTNTNAFVRQSWVASPRLRVTGDLAFHRQRYELGHDVYSGRSFDETYTFVMPRLGVNLALRDAAAGTGGFEHLEGYASFSRANAEPIFRELYDAESATGAIPAFANEDANGRLTDPLIDPERVFDWGAGLRARGPWGTASLGGFWMQFEDEIVFNGTLDDAGNPITGNAARSHHAGIEGDVRTRVGRALELFAAFHWSANRFDDYHEFTGDSTATNDYSGNAIAGFPDRALHASATLRHGGGRLEVGMDYASRQFLDNTESDAASIEPWTVVNALAGWRVAGWAGARELDLSVRVSNVFDRRYETAGYIDFPAPAFAPTPVWIPAATRSVFVALKTTL
jgi:iron complex outermembrane receptor protein